MERCRAGYMSVGRQKIPRCCWYCIAVCCLPIRCSKTKVDQLLVLMLLIHAFVITLQGSSSPAMPALRRDGSFSKSRPLQKLLRVDVSSMLCLLAPSQDCKKFGNRSHRYCKFTSPSSMVPFPVDEFLQLPGMLPSRKLALKFK